MARSDLAPTGQAFVLYERDKTLKTLSRMQLRAMRRMLKSERRSLQVQHRRPNTTVTRLRLMFGHPLPEYAPRCRCSRHTPN